MQLRCLRAVSCSRRAAISPRSCTASQKPLPPCTAGRLGLQHDTARHRLKFGWVSTTTQGRRCAPTAALPSFIAEVSFNAITYTITPIYLLMIAAPAAAVTRWLVQSWLLAALLGALYVFSLHQAWATGALATLPAILHPGSLSPNWSVLSALFNNPMVGVLAWSHLILMDFMMARSIWDEGLRQLVPTSHSLLLCFMFGPLGLASHYVTTRAVWLLRTLRFRRQAARVTAAAAGPEAAARRPWQADDGAAQQQ